MSDRIATTSNRPDPGEHATVLALDIGGSHLSAALVDMAERRAGEVIRRSVDSGAQAGAVLDAWAVVIQEALGEAPVSGVGIAMPGPFEYDRGISRIRGLGKYENLYGCNVRAELKKRLPEIARVPMIFRNDAECFALGEAWAGVARGWKRAIALTLGTGLGSAFVAEGSCVAAGRGVAPDGMLYHVAYGNGQADDFFSTRGLVGLAAGRALGEFADARALAEAAIDDERAGDVFAQWGLALGMFLRPWAEAFGAEGIVAGGNLTRAWELFAPAVIEALSGVPEPIAFERSQLMETATFLGAATLPRRFEEVNDE